MDLWKLAKIGGPVNLELDPPWTVPWVHRLFRFRVLSQEDPIPTEPDTDPTIEPGDPGRPDGEVGKPEGERGGSAAAGQEKARAPADKGGDGGKTLGPYKILEEIGRGGMGVVYKAHHAQLNRTVALKVLIAGEDASEEAITRFHREAEAVAKLGHHPNIVPVYDIGQVTRESAVGAQHAAPLHYFAMHFVEGKPLDRMIDDGEIAPKRAAVITKKIAEALDHAHRHGILHRDVKPANVIMASSEGMSDFRLQISDGSETKAELKSEISNLESTQEPMLTDFGLAKDVQSDAKMTRSGMTLGTPAYMPPEQADGRLAEIDARSDVYALGATFYEMLTYRPPFDGASPGEIIKNIFFHEPTPPRRINRLVEKDLETICLKCLEKEPEKRYATAGALADDLGRFLEGRPIEAKPASAWEKLTKRARRNKPAAVALILLGLVLFAGIPYGIASLALLSRESRDRRSAEQREADSLELAKKGQRASRVLMAAVQGELGGIQKALKRVRYDSRKSPAEKQVVYDGYADRIEAFCRSVDSDPASQSTQWAIKGWLQWLGGYEEKARSAFQRSRGLDEDVPWASLLEAMTWLSVYLTQRRLPSITIISGKFVLGEMPAEQGPVREAREAFDKHLEKAAGSPLWAASPVVDVREALDWMKTGRARDTRGGEQALSKGLMIPELSWVREELLGLRAKVRFLRMDFRGGLDDMTQVLEAQPENAEAHFVRGALLDGAGVEAAQGGKDPKPFHRDAIRSFDAALRLDPGLARAYGGRGLTHWNVGEAVMKAGGDAESHFRKAVEDFTEAVQRAPDLYIARTNRGNAYWNLGRLLGAKGENPLPWFRKAVVEYTAALKRNPTHLASLSNRGEVHLMIAAWIAARGEDAREDYDKAVLDLSECVKRRPGSEEVLFKRANARVGSGRARVHRGEDPGDRYTAAIEDYTRALRKRPGWPEARTHRGNAYRNLAAWRFGSGKDGGDAIRRAVEDYDAVLREDPDFLVARINRGSALLSLGKAERARGGDPGPSIRKGIADFDETLKRTPGDATAWTSKGEAYLELGQFEAARGGDPAAFIDKAIEAYSEALRIHPGYAFAHEGLGIAYVRHGRTLDAKRKDPRAWFRKAVAEFDACLKRNPGRLTAHANRGNALTLLGSAVASRDEDPREIFGEAVEAYTEAVRIHTGYVTGYTARGLTRNFLADAEARWGADPRETYREAIRDYTEALRREPKNADAVGGRGNVYYLLGRAEASRGGDPSSSYARALEDYDRAVRGNPSDWRTWMNKGVLCEVLRRFDEAVKAYESALAVVGDRAPPVLQKNLARARAAARGK
ncbi:MAG: protein kinase domain-containing protein [Planctomycetota bacterium]|jgi:serine/threonine-protein kinase